MCTVQFKIMTSWALVADVYFLPPQTKLESETSAEFATRVQELIAKVAKLRIVPWDGYLKYYNLAEKVCTPGLGGHEACRGTICDPRISQGCRA